MEFMPENFSKFFQLHYWKNNKICPKKIFGQIDLWSLIKLQLENPPFPPIITKISPLDKNIAHICL